MSSIGDRAVVHVAKIQGDYPTFIGNNVTISAGAMVHAATLSDNVMIGESAQVLDGSIVEMNAIIAPGAVVTPKVKMGELWSGSPAKKELMLTDQEIAGISSIALETVVLAQQHAVENAKDYIQLLEEEELADIELYIWTIGNQNTSRRICRCSGARSSRTHLLIDLVSPRTYADTKE